MEAGENKKFDIENEKESYPTNAKEVPFRFEERGSEVILNAGDNEWEKRSII